MTNCNKGRSVFRCHFLFFFLSDYEYWVFSQVTLWNCCDPHHPPEDKCDRKQHLLLSDLLWQKKYLNSEVMLGFTNGTFAMDWVSTACGNTALVLEWFYMSLWSSVSLCLPFLRLNQRKLLLKTLAFFIVILSGVFSICPCLQNKTEQGQMNELNC